jgi:N-carbamoyl-L-amino-acid hydrolase
MRPAMVKFLEGICQEQGQKSMALPSGAGHDAMHWADFAPVGMLFIPCREGISHNPAEYASLEDILNVTGILEAAVKAASQADRSF